MYVTAVKLFIFFGSHNRYYCWAERYCPRMACSRKWVPEYFTISHVLPVGVAFAVGCKYNIDWLLLKFDSLIIVRTVIQYIGLQILLNLNHCCKMPGKTMKICIYCWPLHLLLSRMDVLYKLCADNLLTGFVLVSLVLSLDTDVLQNGDDGRIVFLFRV